MLLCSVGPGIHALFVINSPVNNLSHYSSLSSVPPPDVWYRLMLPQEVAVNGYLSALQLEAIVYACQQHETLLADGSRRGFLIGRYDTLTPENSLFIDMVNGLNLGVSVICLA